MSLPTGNSTIPASHTDMESQAFADSQLSIPPSLTSSTPSSTMSAPVDLGDVSPIDDERNQNGVDAEADGDADAEESDFPGSTNSSPSKLNTSSGAYRKSGVRKQQDVVTVPMDELSGLLVGFAFALQYVLSLSPTTRAEQ